MPPPRRVQSGIYPMCGVKIRIMMSSDGDEQESGRFKVRPRMPMAIPVCMPLTMDLEQTVTSQAKGSRFVSALTMLFPFVSRYLRGYVACCYRSEVVNSKEDCDDICCLAIDVVAGVRRPFTSGSGDQREVAMVTR